MGFWDYVGLSIYGLLLLFGFVAALRGHAAELKARQEERETRFLARTQRIWEALTPAQRGAATRAPR